MVEEESCSSKAWEMVEEEICSSKARVEGMVKEVVETCSSMVEEVREMEEEEICSSMVGVVMVKVVVGTCSSKDHMVVRL